MTLYSSPKDKVQESGEGSRTDWVNKQALGTNETLIFMDLQSRESLFGSGIHGICFLYVDGWIHDVMPTPFTAIGIQRITMQGSFQAAPSASLVIFLIKMVSLDLKRKLLPDSEVSQQIVCRKDWRGYSNFRKERQENLANYWFLGLGSHEEGLSNMISQGVNPSLYGVQWAKC